MGALRKTASAAGLLGLTMPVLAQNTSTIPGTANASGLVLPLKWTPRLEDEREVGCAADVSEAVPGSGHANSKVRANDDSHFLVGWRGATHEIPVSLPGFNAFARFTVKPTDASCP